MKLALIGVGQAGGKVVEALCEYEAKAGVDFVVDAMAVNTARADLAGLDRIPESRRVLIGQARVKGHGVGADNELGAEVAAEDADEVLSVVDQFRTHEVDAFLVVAGLGGGTGSGGAPVLARELRRLYTEPVYGLGILPGQDEGGIYTLNAARSFKTFVDEVDNLLVFDNDAWRQSGESVSGGFDRTNEELARRLGVLFSAGETNARGAVAESVVDASEIINTLAGGGVSTIGFASTAVNRPKRGLLSRLSKTADDETRDDGEAANRVSSLVRRATLGRLTLPCEVAGSERALLVLAGPPAEISRRGMERSRRWLEAETGSMEVRGGDYPMKSGHVAAVVLLAGVTDVPRVKELQRVAIEAQRDMHEKSATSSAKLQELLRSGSAEQDALEPLF
ncbi:tubulin/FtsZ family protein [Halogeometricum limi]|uniref:Tubulin-like protein CetZ n=1 Tax=Halogeometricum limi TaxID=555875 RepID=A0A1I6GX56_9EURY|nr:tubulin/FtsZ family protein [Halogeometricum limi]SFR46768.1 Cell division GTPase FtsZ [Halogeometricum limi]